jgi:FkbM family methyltransferase
MPGLIRRAVRRARKESLAVGRAVTLARSADGLRATPALFLVGMAHATPARWAGSLLRAGGVARLRLRPRRLQGYELVVDPSDGGHTCVVEEFFVPPVAYDLELITFTPSAVIDCGAHIGAFTLLARRRFPSAALTAFEPNPGNVEWLRDNVRRNHLTGVEVVPAAVSTAAGRSLFRFTPNESEGGRLSESGLRRPGAAETEVTVVDLPAFVRRLAPASLLLKLDIEGEEERLMSPLLAALPRTCAIFFETHRGVEGWDAVRGALEAGAFSTRLLRQRDVFFDGLAVRM